VRRRTAENGSQGLGIARFLIQRDELIWFEVVETFGMARHGIGRQLASSPLLHRLRAVT